MDDTISRQAVIDALEKVAELYPWRVPGDRDSYSQYNEAWQDALNRADSEIEALPSAQPERLTNDDFETIRIHLNAYKEKLCNQKRWKEANEYQNLIDRFMAFASAQQELAQDLPNACADAISRQAAIDIANDLRDCISVDGYWAWTERLTRLPSVQPQRKTDEWCTDCREYDSEKHCCPRWNRVIRQTLSEQTEWNNHTVACLLAELFGDACACNYNGIDEWLPEKCEVIDACPNPVGVACWEQFLKHRAERRTDERY